MKKALICGVSGQDGSYLAKFLLTKNYEVFGTSRDAQIASFANLDKLGIRNQVHTVSIALNDFRSVLQVASTVEPDEIYNLSGQTSVGPKKVPVMKLVRSDSLPLYEGHELR